MGKGILADEKITVSDTTSPPLLAWATSNRAPFIRQSRQQQKPPSHVAQLRCCGAADAGEAMGLLFP